MNGSSSLEPVFHEILGVINPLLEDCTARVSAIDQLRAVIATVESLRGAIVEPSGSFLSTLFTRWEDLDMSLELSNGSHILSPGKKHKLNLLEDVLRALRTTDTWKLSGCSACNECMDCFGDFTIFNIGVRKLQLISNTKVPVLKFTSDRNISCEISINNLSGHMKSKFLLWISVIDPRFRDMVLLVKEWAKAHELNDPKDGTFNSYSLCLLVIFHFQTCKPAIFPPLKEIYPTNLGEELQGVRSAVEQRFQEVCAANINKFRSRRRTNRSSLSQLFVSFLAKFADISNRARAQGISTFTGTWEDIETTASWQPKTYALMIEDPLEQTENAGRTVVGSQLTRISETFHSSYRLLSYPNQNRISLIRAMVRPQTWRHLLPRNHGSYPSNRRPRPFPQKQRKAQPPPTKQGGKASQTDQAGDAGVEDSNKRAVQASSSRGNAQPPPTKQGGKASQTDQAGDASVEGSNKRAVRASSSRGNARQVWKPKNLTVSA